MKIDSEFANQFINSSIVALFILGGWMLSVYALEDPTVFGDRGDDNWVLSAQDSDGDGNLDEDEAVILESGALFDEGLTRHIALLKIKGFALYSVVFSGCMIAQRFTPKQTIPPEVLEKLKKN